MNRHQRRKAKKNIDFKQTSQQDLINAIEIHKNKDFETAEREYRKNSTKKILITMI